MMSLCPACNKTVDVGQTFVGFPVVRIVALNQSQLAGTEILFHVSCFLGAFKKPLDIIKL